ncbi:hypothetical protein D3C73_1314900 [compost metagenome]
MEINITYEQIAIVVEKEIVKRIDKNLNHVIQEHYKRYQHLEEVIERIIEKIVERRLTDIYSDKQLKELITSENVSKVVADKLIKTVSEEVVDRLLYQD